MLKPLKRKTLAEEIIKSILELIKDGKIKPGDKLPGERDLAEQLKVSRASVREALRALSLTGVLTIRPGDGTYLNKTAEHLFNDLLNNKLNYITKKSDFLQLIEARKILESQLVKLATQRAIPEVISSLEKSVRKMRDHFNDVEIFIKEDVKFHITISEAAGNKILYHAVSAVRDLLTNVQRAIVEISGLRNRSLKYHMQILEYIRANNAEKAAEVMDKHIADVEKAVKECINSKAFMFYVDSQN